ncbi:MAG: hypothetical protein SO015_04840 [Wujia sp.]|nr:hypothetical protein [Wujia sp.]MDY3727468.1 hypothetical protein [Wujia sp.]
MNDRSKINWEYLLICVLGTIFLALYAISTSPLTSNFWGWDSAFFQMVGKNLNHGLVMYKDIFDIKGPYLFTIQYLGYATSNGRYGIFVIEILNLCITLYFLQKTVNLVAKKYRKQCLLVSLLLFFFFLACTLDCGNLSEEYALPYLFFCLFLYARYKVENKMGLAALGYGIAFGMVSLGRVTNCAFICVLVLDVIIDMIIAKEWKGLLKCAVFFLVGGVVAIGPFFAYFAAKGILTNMIEVVYTFSFSYAVESSFVESLAAMRWTIIAVFFLIEGMALKACRKNCREKVFLVINAIVMVITLNLGNAYIHYYQIIIPSMLIAFWVWWNRVDEKKKIKHGVIALLGVAVILNAIYFVPYTGRTVAAMGVNTPEREQSTFGKFAQKIERLDAYGRGYYGYKAQMQVDDILEKIPQANRNSVFNYETKAQWLLLSELKPYSKYCITADHFSCLSEKVAADIQKMFETDAPQYIVTGCDAKIENKYVQERLKEDYACTYKNDAYALYQQK